MENFSKTELENEQWKDIEGYDGMYQVSDLGRVRSKKYGDWRVLRVQKHNCGYLKVSLHKDTKQKSVYVHRLVAQAFIPNDDKRKTIINHIDDSDKQNNRVSNLEWCDYQYNNTYNDLQYRRPHPNYKRTKIKDLYRSDLTYQQNIDMFKEQGIECSKWVIRRLRKDLGLSKNHSNN